MISQFLKASRPRFAVEWPKPVSSAASRRPGRGREDQMNGLLVREWQPCGWCDTRGYVEHQIDVDLCNRYECPYCEGQGEIESEILIPEDEPTEKWFEEQIA